MFLPNRMALGGSIRPNINNQKPTSFSKTGSSSETGSFSDTASFSKTASSPVFAKNWENFETLTVFMITGRITGSGG